MTTLIKLLPAEAAPAKTVLERAHALALTSAQRAALPKSVHASSGDVTIAVPAEQLREVEVDDVLLDEQGAFWVVRPAVEKVLNVTGDVNVMREAVGALINRGVRVAQTEDGFAVLPLPNLAQMLEMVGLEVTEAEAPFDPIQFAEEPADGCGCGCGCGCGGHHHHHHHHGECGCGGHHHDHEEGECCCGGHHHEHGEGECGCGGHHHDHEEGECCCGGHHHEHGEGECGCGHHHHDHEEGECGCGGHHHEHGEGECGCGGHHHDHEEGECCCGGHHHEHDEKKA